LFSILMRRNTIHTPKSPGKICLVFITQFFRNNVNRRIGFFEFFSCKFQSIQVDQFCKVSTQVSQSSLDCFWVYPCLICRCLQAYLVCQYLASD
jgi:hypothetical protein